MADTVTKIMAEILNVLAITTIDIKQGRMSKLLLYNMLRLTKPLSEKYLKELIRNTDNGNDIEYALKRLDRLTQEEAQMAAAQFLKVTKTIDNRVGEIADNMLGVDYRIASIGDQVQVVDDKATTVMDGAQYIFYLLS